MIGLLVLLIIIYLVLARRRDIAKVSLLPFCDGTSISTDPAPRWSQFPATQAVNVGCNELSNTQSLSFCDGTTMGPGNSFDVKAPVPLVLEGVATSEYSSASIIMNGRVLQQAPAQTGYLGLDKDAAPLPAPLVSGVDALRNFADVTPSGFTSVVTGITFSPELGLFVAITNTSSIATSVDGVNWIPGDSLQARGWRSIVWVSEISRFVVVGETNSQALTGTLCMTSPNGTTWTLQNTPGLTTSGGRSWYGIAWSPKLQLFVAVGTATESISIMTSPDGVSWTGRGAPNDVDWRSVIWVPQYEYFLAVGQGGTGNRVMISQNGIEWTTYPAVGTNDWLGVTWSPQLGMFAACANNSNTSIMTSFDGKVWTERTVPTNLDSRMIVWAAELGLFVMINSLITNPSRLVYSADGINWFSVPFFTSQVVSIYYCAELGVIVSGGLNVNSRIQVSQLSGRPVNSFTLQNTSLNRIAQNSLVTYGSISNGAPITVTTSPITLLPQQTRVLFNSAGTITVTLPAASSYVGMEIHVKNLSTGAVNSASLNVVPIDSATAGNALLPAAAQGQSRTLVSDGTNWIVTQTS